MFSLFYFCCCCGLECGPPLALADILTSRSRARRDPPGVLGAMEQSWTQRGVWRQTGRYDTAP